MNQFYGSQTFLRSMAMDERSVNRAIQPSNLPIPRNEDIKVKKGKYSNFFKT